MNRYLITEANRQDLVSWLRQGNVQRVSDALLNLAPVSTLTAERDALAKDAARYRWIVKNTDCSFGLATFQLDVPHPSYALDVCIDTAIAKESKT